MENRKTSSGESKKGVNSAKTELTTLFDSLDSWAEDDWFNSENKLNCLAICLL